MFKLIAFLALFVAVNAGVISHGGYIAAAPAHIAVAAPVAHHATSYANHNSVSVHPVAVAHAAPAAHVVHAAPAAHVVHAAPVVHAASVLHAAPVAHVGLAHGHHGFFH